MGVKMSGKQFKEFWRAEWVAGRPNLYADDDHYKVNGVECGSEFEYEMAADTDKIEVMGGVVMDNDDADFDRDLTRVARDWLRRQTHTTVLVTVENSKVGALEVAIKQAIPDAAIQR